MNNKNKKLYIIGNGFDITHGLNTKLSDYREFLKKQDPEAIEFFDENFHITEWNKAEEVLGEVEHEIIKERSLWAWPNMLDDNPKYGDYIYEINKNIDNGIRLASDSNLRNWILSINISDLKPLLNIDKSEGALYLNFNYTEVLEKIYLIPDKNILHIHGQVSCPQRKLQFGHNSPTECERLLTRLNDPKRNEGIDFGYILDEAEEIIAEYYWKTKKDVNGNISKNVYFWGSLNDVSEVFVLGHSCQSIIDFPYFLKVKENISKNVKWTYVYYDNHIEAEEESYLNNLELAKIWANNLGMVKENVIFLDWVEFKKKN